MKNIILIKYGELTTKKDNRKFFINTLYNNLLDKLSNLNIEIIKEHSRMYIEFYEEDIDKIINVLHHTFGIHAFNLAYKVNTNNEEIENKALFLLNMNKYNTFKVVTKRCDKNFPVSSIEFNDIIGSFILKNKKNIKVNVHNPDVYVNIEINKDSTYIYLNDIKGIGGYPVSVLGKGLLMLSGGIDSPVAGYLALKRGLKIDCIYFEAIPHTSLNARYKVIDLCKKLLDYSSDFNLYIVPITKLQEAIYKNIDPTYIVTILRRMMYRISEEVAKKYKYLCLINGESIGQVASQTLTSISCINEVTNMPVIRPVACFDKLEIIDIAKKIDTYDISILPYEDCCTIFVPKHPIINPKIDKCKQLENLINYDELIKEAINDIKIININKKISEFNDVL